MAPRTNILRRDNDLASIAQVKELAVEAAQMTTQKSHAALSAKMDDHELTVLNQVTERLGEHRRGRLAYEDAMRERIERVAHRLIAVELQLARPWHARLADRVRHWWYDTEPARAYTTDADAAIAVEGFPTLEVHESRVALPPAAAAAAAQRMKRSGF